MESTTSQRAPATPGRGGEAGLARRASRAHLIPRRLYPVFLVVLTAALVLTVLAAISVGSVSLPLGTVWAVMLDRSLGIDTGVQIDPRDSAIIWNFRAPRALLGVVVGAALAVAGAALQALVRNPLADPYVLGVVQGGSLGAVLVLALGTAAIGKLALSGVAFVGATLALLLVLVFSRRRGRVSPARLILAGVAVGYVFQAATSFIQLRMIDGQSMAGVVFWLLGTLAAASWRDLGVPTVVMLACSAWLLAQYRTLNALLMGEDAAVALGVKVSSFRLQLAVVASVLTASVVAIAGGIGFVGLMIPHTARLLVGADHRRLLPVTALGGALFLVLVDLVGRVVMRPLEIPLSVITAAIGGPVFLWLMNRSERTPGVS
ncbi:MAG: iron ABC transporter permease [Kineosporiaceae bacterium]|nr:iron ABC transporter permease [Kineosporiaceae bacterium]